MTDWNWALIIIVAAGGFALVAAHRWWAESKRRGKDAWERLVRHRFPSSRPKMGGSDEDEKTIRRRRWETGAEVV